MDYPVRVVARGRFRKPGIEMQRQPVDPLPRNVTEQVKQVWQSKLSRLNFEFVFLARTRLTARQVIEHARTAKSANEHCQLEPLPWQCALARGLLLWPTPTDLSLPDGPALSSACGTPLP